MSRHNLFPDAHKDGQETRLARAWTLDYPLPVPARHRPLRCPCCGIGDLVLKDWKFHTRQRTGSKAPWRCDVRMKCMTCGHVPIFGVPVTEAYHSTATERGAFAHNRQWISWREGKRVLSEAGYFD